MTSANAGQTDTGSRWVRIPDGTKVRHRHEAYEGYIDGLTELVQGQGRNPDGKTQYRVNVGDGPRLLVSEEHLSILLDRDNLIIIGREKKPYRQVLTASLQATFAEDRFVPET